MFLQKGSRFLEREPIVEKQRNVYYYVHLNVHIKDGYPSIYALPSINQPHNIPR